MLAVHAWAAFVLRDVMRVQKKSHKNFLLKKQQFSRRWHDHEKPIS